LFQTALPGIQLTQLPVASAIPHPVRMSTAPTFVNASAARPGKSHNMLRNTLKWETQVGKSFFVLAMTTKTYFVRLVITVTNNQDKIHNCRNNM